MKKILISILLVIPIFCLAQVKTVGTPNIQNYSKAVYKAGTQNWDMSQDANGFMYFANNEGLLTFDGVLWDLIPIPESTPLRSVLVDSKNNIYVGLTNDFGIINNEEPERSVFNSLKDLLPTDCGEFEEVWHIYEISDGIVFQSFKYLFVLSENNEVKLLQPQTSFYFSFQIDNKLYVQESGVGVSEFVNGELKPLPVSDKLIDAKISAILKLDETRILIGTEANGIFVFQDGKIEKWDTPANHFLEKNKLYSATTIPGNYFAFGTILNGLIIADSDGNIVQSLNTSNGIQNNTILSTFADKDGNLWLGLDNGIDYLETNSPLSFIGNSTDLGTGYCCRVFNENLYLGTNQGLFVRPFNRTTNNQAFELVNNTAGQVWSLDEFDGQLICGHNLGTFVVEGKEARKISDVPGAWKFIQLKNNPAYLLGGHFYGLQLLKKGAKGWEFHKRLEGFTESSRFLNQNEEGEIWISHGGKGIFKVVLNGIDDIVEYKQYSLEDGLPSNTGNKLLEFKGELFISTITQVYKYEQTSNSFIVASNIDVLQNIDGQIKLLEEDDAGNVWLIADNEAGVLRLNEDRTYTKITSPFTKLRNKFVNEFEFIYPYNNENVFVAIEDGFAHYTSEFPKSYSSSFQSFITKIEVPYIDTTLYFNGAASILDLDLPFRKNAFRFHFAAPFYENDTPIVFSYFLEGFTDKWSVWSNDSYKDFTNFREGEYVLKLKAKNIFEVESDVASIQFVISPPWHRSNTAYLLYILFVLLVTFLLVKLILYRLNQSKQKEVERHNEEMQQQKELSQHQAVIAEKEIIKLRNDKLRSEKVHRDKELANQTMGLVHKNKLLINITEELQLIHNLIKSDSAKTKIYGLKKRINKEIDNKQQNKIFESYFDEVHEEFFSRLKEKFPNLTPKDLRMCAFIKMNISTKEIATILNISYRGAEISRYRLRKKLDISREINLSIFLSSI